MAERLRDRRQKLLELDATRASVLQEIEHLESFAHLLRELDPFIVVDEQTPSPYAKLGLKSLTLARACEAILRAKGQPASSRDLLDILVAEGKLKHGKNSSLISVINALKGHPDWFIKQGSEWTLSNGEKPES